MLSTREKFLQFPLFFLLTLILAAGIHELGHALMSELLDVRYAIAFARVYIYSNDAAEIFKTGLGGNLTTLFGAYFAFVFFLMMRLSHQKALAIFCLLLAFNCILITSVNGAIGYWM